jgi:hypothetical protein
LVLTTLLLFCCNMIPNSTPAAPATFPARETRVSTSPDGRVGVEVSRPDAPTPKVTLTPASDLESSAGGEAYIQPAINTPVKPAITESYETPNERKAWYALMIWGHGTAVFDAWTTRRAIGEGYAVEGDPLQRPFAHSGAIYASTQVTPLIMDFVGHRMMRSSHSWMRKAWWVPQAASGGVSLGAGVHNYGMVP